MHRILAILLALWPLMITAQEGTGKLERKVRAQLDKGKAYPALRNAHALVAKDDNATNRALRAEGYNQIGEHAKAATDARRSLQIRPIGNVNGLMQLAMAEQGLGQLDSAAGHLRAVLHLAPSVEARYRLALVELQRSDAPTAMAEIDRALAPFHPGDVAATKLHRVKGEIAATLGDTVLARQQLDLAVQLAPTDPVNYNSRGYYLHAVRGQHAQAIADYNKAVKLNPNYSYAFNNRGWSLYKSGFTAKGLGDIERARRRKPNNPYVYRNLGIIALETGDTTKACTYFRQALDKGYTAQFGPEVEERIKASCGTAPPVQAPRSTLDRPTEHKGIRSNAPE